MYGYTTVHIAEALSEDAHIFAYDLWEKGNNRSKIANMEVAEKNIKKHGVADRVTLGTMDFYEWLKKPSDFNLLHLDIGNTGEVIRKTAKSLRAQIESGSVILFEGGTEERDNVSWIKEYGHEPMFPLKESIGYEIVDSRFPGLSIMTKETLKNV